MEFFTNYTKRPKPVSSYNSGELKVEAAGYRPAYKEIASMIISGQTFEASRESFQYQDEASIEREVNHVDTYDKDEFEMIDIARENSRILGEQIASSKAAKAKADEEAKKQSIIADYEKSKALAEASTKEGL